MNVIETSDIRHPVSQNQIVMQDVTHKIGQKIILSNITVTLQERRIGIIGANGSGKSSFSRLLNGLIIPSSGSITIDGLDTKRDGKAIRRKVGFIFQNPDNQIIMPTVEEDLAFGLNNIKLSKEEIGTRIDKILSHYGLQSIKTQAAHSLSGGQKQLLAICGVLVMQPEIMVFDEPTTMLDLRNKQQIAAHIKNLSQRVILVTHDLDLLSDFERVLVIDEGKIVFDGTPHCAINFYKNLMQC